MIKDRFSGRHTSESATAIRHFETAVRALAEHRPGAAEALDAALDHDPALVSAHALKGFGAVLLAKPELGAFARAALAAAQFATARHGCVTPGERALVRGLALAVEGRLLAAADALEAQLAEDPYDFALLKLSHALRFMGGDLDGMLRTTRAVLPAWGPDMEGRGFVFGCHAFALEEAGFYELAERFGRSAVESERRDAWGLHAVCHVHEMQKRTADGIRWLEDARPAWSGCNNFASHVGWHLALFHAEDGDFDRALALYDADVRPLPSDDYRDFANAASLLWRLGQFGVRVGDRWDELAAQARTRCCDTTLMFACLHRLMALVAAGERLPAARLLGALLNTAADDIDGQATVAREVALDVARALIGVPDAGETLDLARTAAALPRLGGSHAQRDVFVRTLALIAARMGDTLAFEQIMALRRRNRSPDSFTHFAQARRAAASPPSMRAICA